MLVWRLYEFQVDGPGLVVVIHRYMVAADDPSIIVEHGNILFVVKFLQRKALETFERLSITS
jgi:hypothetical protein